MLLQSWLTSIFGQSTASTGNSKFQYIEKELQKTIVMWNGPANMLSTRVLLRVVALSWSVEVVKITLVKHP